jgi:hypothetical protein
MNKFIELLQRNVLIAPLIALLLVIIGFTAGLVVGWMTVDFRPSADDVSAAADSFALNANPELARRRLQGLSKAEQETILNQLIRDRASRGLTREVERLVALGPVLGVSVSGVPSGVTTPGATPLATRPPGTTTPTTPPSGGGLDPLLIVLGVLLLVILAGIAAVIFIRKILPTLSGGRTLRESAVPTATEQIPASTTVTRFPSAPAPTTTAGGLGRFVPQYVIGNDNYDTSYSLETARGEFLGECGIGISETIGEGKPDKVTAFDIWLFDKADVRTVTKILMSEFAFNDQTLRTKLATKGEAMLAEKGKTLHLETQSLSIDAHIVELVYANNPSFPSNSHFQKLIVEIVPTQKGAR